MAELVLEDYMNKLNEIKIECENVNATKASLEILIDELASIENVIDNNPVMPLTISHLNLIILVNGIRLSKNDLQYYLINFIKIRQDELVLRTINNTGTPTERLAYEEETRNIKEYTSTLKSSCPCMSSKNKIIQYESNH